MNEKTSSNLRREMRRVKMRLFMSIESILSDEFEILFWKNKILQSLLEIYSILTSFGKEEIFISIVHDEAFYILPCHARIESEKCTLTPMVINHRLNDFHTYCPNKNIVVHWELLECEPELLMSEGFECTEFTHVTYQSNSFTTIFLSETYEHLDARDNWLKSSIVCAIDNQTLVNTSKHISSCMREMNMTEIRDDIERIDTSFSSNKKSAN